jgi:hypothetical protein
MLLGVGPNPDNDSMGGRHSYACLAPRWVNQPMPCLALLCLRHRICVSLAALTGSVKLQQRNVRPVSGGDIPTLARRQIVAPFSLGVMVP